MNYLILFSSFSWIIAMSILLCFNSSSTTVIVSYFVIAINIVTSIYHIKTEDIRRSLELRIYSDNLIVLILISQFPKDLFFGYTIQILFSIFITHLYLRNKVRMYNILMFLILTEIVLYLPLCSLKMSYQFIYNTTSMLLLFLVLFIVKKKIMLDPEKKYKKIILDTNTIINHQIIECISPMFYYIRDLDEDKKEKMERLITRLKYIAQNRSNNFAQIISMVKGTLLNVTDYTINVTLVDQTTRIIDLDSYTLLLVIYTLFNHSISSMATDIIVKFSNRKIEIIDNGVGLDVKSKKFESTNMKIALGLLELRDIPVKVSSVAGAGTTVTLFI